MIQITANDNTYILEIDDPTEDTAAVSCLNRWRGVEESKVPSEVNFFHKLRELNDADKYVNTGTSQQTIVVVKKKEGKQNTIGSKVGTLLFNEQVSLYFWRSQIDSKKVVSSGARIKAFGKQKIEKFTKRSFSKEYSPILYRTHSYLDLLDLQRIQESLDNLEPF